MSRKGNDVRVLLAAPTMGMGGSELVLLNLLRHIDRARFDPHLVLLRAVGERISDLPTDIVLHELGCTHARFAVMAFVKLCWKIRPAVVLSTSAHLNSATVAARPFLPKQTVLLTREGADLYSPELKYGRLRLALYRCAYAQADAVICQSDHMKNDLIQRFRLDPCRVERIYNPVDIDSIRSLADAEPSPFQSSGPNLVAVGRLSHEKGFDVLLGCMPRIREAVPHVSLTIVGDGPEAPVLVAQCRALGLDDCVSFAGMHPNPYPWIKHADLLVLPSRTEAPPNVVLESVALGTPVIASNCNPALREISASTDLVTIARDISSEELGGEIAKAIATPHLSRCQASREQFQTRFGVHSIVRQYERLFLARSDSPVDSAEHRTKAVQSSSTASVLSK